MPPLLVDLREAKRAAARDLPSGHPGREALFALPDRARMEDVRASFPLLVRLLKHTPSEGR